MRGKEGRSFHYGNCARRLEIQVIIHRPAAEQIIGNQRQTRTLRPATCRRTSLWQSCVDRVPTAGCLLHEFRFVRVLQRAYRSSKPHVLRRSQVIAYIGEVTRAPAHSTSQLAKPCIRLDREMDAHISPILRLSIPLTYGNGRQHNCTISGADAPARISWRSRRAYDTSVCGSTHKQRSTAV